MNPKEPLVPPIAVALANRLAGILIQELPNHGLGDRVDDIRIGSFSAVQRYDGTRALLLKVRGVHENVII